MPTTKVKVPPSCWGCGHDYLERWKPEDLAPHPGIHPGSSNNDSSVDDSDKVCPDCHEEITEGV